MPTPDDTFVKKMKQANTFKDMLACAREAGRDDIFTALEMVASEETDHIIFTSKRQDGRSMAYPRAYEAASRRAATWVHIALVSPEDRALTTRMVINSRGPSLVCLAIARLVMGEE